MILKPCPFCGCADINVFEHPYDRSKVFPMIECKNCKIIIGTNQPFQQRDAMIKITNVWNRRANKSACDCCGAETSENELYSLVIEKIGIELEICKECQSLALCEIVEKVRNENH